VTAVRWLVDGMNVVGSRPDGWWRDRRGAMQALAERLGRFASAGGDEVAVVFDGREDGDWAAGIAGVEIAFAPGGRGSADDEIVRRVRADRAPGELQVVTSDADLARRVRELGAAAVGAGDFRRSLEEG
jgi:predicted RNA-binding protein with PIN domain